MGSFRSKEDDVSKILTSIFVTNFLDSFSAMVTWSIRLFQQRGQKMGSVNMDKTKNESNKRKFDGSHKNVENTVIGKSFVSVVKTSRMPIDKESPPASILEDDCLNAKDLTLSLMDRVKEMASLVNLKKALYNKGRLVWVELDGVPFKFLSGPTFKRIAAKWGELLDVDDYNESNLHSKRICILSKTPEFSEEEEEDELSVEDNNDGRINDLDANNGIDEGDMEEVLETLFDQPDDQKDKHSEDPFGLYP
ncbi:hypothetical protein Tco_1481233, partial [Tanacetum coccineum]